MSHRIVPLIITVGCATAFAALLGLSPIGLTPGQPAPSICHVPPGNPEQAHAIPPDDASYPAHLPGGVGHETDFLITEGLTCPATVPTVPTTPPDVTINTVVITEPTVPTTQGDTVTTPVTVVDVTSTAAPTTVTTVAVLPTGTVAQTTPTLPRSK